MNAVMFDRRRVYPSKVVCVGRNYVEHIEELNNEIPDEPVIFIKPNSSIAHEVHATATDPLDFEAEITFLIESGKIQGVGIGLDLTKRQIQSGLKAKGLPWERAKAFDRSAVFSDFVCVDHDLKRLRMELYVNGELTQAAGCDLMLTKPSELLDEIKTFMTLVDGDLMMTGTPKGVGQVHRGDRFNGKVIAGDELLVEGSWVAR